MSVFRDLSHSQFRSRSISNLYCNIFWSFSFRLAEIYLHFLSFVNIYGCLQIYIVRKVDIRDKYHFLDGRVFGVATLEHEVFSLRETLAGNLTGSGVVGWSPGCNRIMTLMYSSHYTPDDTPSLPPPVYYSTDEWVKRSFIVKLAPKCGRYRMVLNILLKPTSCMTFSFCSSRYYTAITRCHMQMHIIAIL